MTAFEGLAVLALFAGTLALYVGLSIAYRRFLFRMVPDEDQRAPEVEEPAEPGDVRCPRCGALNDAGFEHCYDCAGRLPADPAPEVEEPGREGST